MRTAPSFFGAFVASRQPRTLAGVRPDGTLLLVTVDGRRPGWSVGMTLPEAARLMRSLGATDALNLDGGPSTQLVAKLPGLELTVPGWGVPNALVVTPGKR